MSITLSEISAAGRPESSTYGCDILRFLKDNTHKVRTKRSAESLQRNSAVLNRVVKAS